MSYLPETCQSKEDGVCHLKVNSCEGCHFLPEEERLWPFILWYSGMEEKKVLAAYKRWLNETYINPKPTNR